MQMQPALHSVIVVCCCISCCTVISSRCMHSTLGLTPLAMLKLQCSYHAYPAQASPSARLYFKVECPAVQHAAPLLTSTSPTAPYAWQCLPSANAASTIGRQHWFSMGAQHQQSRRFESCNEGLCREESAFQPAPCWLLRCKLMQLWLRVGAQHWQAGLRQPVQAG